MLPRVPFLPLLAWAAIVPAIAASAAAAPAYADSTADGAQAERPAPAQMPQPAMKPPAPVMVGACRGQRFIGQRVACYSDRAVRAGDPKVCFEAEDPDVRWPCVAKYAVVAGDADTCRLLPGPRLDAGSADAGTGGDAAVTVDLCLSTLALVYRRPELCRQLRTDPMDDACLAKLVANGADPALCRAVKSSDLREVCRPDPLQEVRE